MKYVVLLFVLLTVSCENYIARQAGGNLNLELLPGQKLVNVTWKEGNLWYLTRPMRPDETPESYSFRESSMFGIMEGTVTINESR